MNGCIENTDLLLDTAQLAALIVLESGGETSRAEEIATINDYVCPRCFLIEGCPRCAEKAKTALESDRVAMMDGKFAIISKPTTKKAAEAALRACGLEAIFSLPVLD